MKTFSVLLLLVLFCGCSASQTAKICAQLDTTHQSVEQAYQAAKAACEASPE